MPNKKNDKSSHLVGLITGLTTAAVLVAAGVVIWKVISDRQEENEKSSDK